jgi:4-hydroxybenzoate polyprenyltransferase
LKQYRPIAAGRISPVLAGWLSALLLGVSAFGAWFLSHRFSLILVGYILLQIVYTFWLKRFALIDILVIASGFVLRAIAGAWVLNDVTISPWLLLCTFLLALFLALCKRRQEKTAADDKTVSLQRASLASYDERLLDILIGTSSAVTILSYSIYTLWPATVAKFGTRGLGFTIPFVIFGIFRYLYLVYRHDQGERPEKVLLKDGPLLINLVLYGIAIVLIFTLKGRYA